MCARVNQLDGIYCFRSSAYWCTVDSKSETCEMMSYLLLILELCKGGFKWSFSSFAFTLIRKVFKKNSELLIVGIKLPVFQWDVDLNLNWWPGWNYLFFSYVSLFIMHNIQEIYCYSVIDTHFWNMRFFVYVYSLLAQEKLVLVLFSFLFSITMLLRVQPLKFCSLNTYVSEQSWKMSALRRNLYPRLSIMG